MKKRTFIRVISLTLVFLCSLGSIACNKSGDQSTPITTPITTPQPTPPVEPEPMPTIPISVINGKLDSGKATGMYEEGDTVTLTAARPAKGYRFTHWEDSQGNIVGTTTEQRFSYIQIDTKDKKVYVTTIGSGDDRVYDFE